MPKEVAGEADGIPVVWESTRIKKGTIVYRKMQDEFEDPRIGFDAWIQNRLILVPNIFLFSPFANELVFNRASSGTSYLFLILILGL